MVPPVKHTGVRGNPSPGSRRARVSGLWPGWMRDPGASTCSILRRSVVLPTPVGQVPGSESWCGVVNRGDQAFFGGNQGRMCDRVSLEIRQALGQGRVSSSRGKPAPLIALELPICLDDVMLLPPEPSGVCLQRGWTASCMDRIHGISRTRSNSGNSPSRSAASTRFLRFDRCQKSRGAVQ